VQRREPFGACGYNQATYWVDDATCCEMGCMLLTLRLCTDVDVLMGQVTRSPSAAAPCTQIKKHLLRHARPKPWKTIIVFNLGVLQHAWDTRIAANFVIYNVRYSNGYTRMRALRRDPSDTTSSKKQAETIDIHGLFTLMTTLKTE